MRTLNFAAKVLHFFDVRNSLCLFFEKNDSSEEKDTRYKQWKAESGDGKVQDFNKTCTFFCVCRKFVVPLHAKRVQMGKHGNKTTEEQKSKRDQVGR